MSPYVTVRITKVEPGHRSFLIQLFGIIVLTTHSGHLIYMHAVVYPWMKPAQDPGAMSSGGLKARSGGDLSANSESTYTVKKVSDFPVPNRNMSLTKLSLAGNILIIPGQEEFGY